MRYSSLNASATPCNFSLQGCKWVIFNSPLKDLLRACVLWWELPKAQSTFKFCNVTDVKVPSAVQTGSGHRKPNLLPQRSGKRIKTRSLLLFSRLLPPIAYSSDQGRAIYLQRARLYHQHLTPQSSRLSQFSQKTTSNSPTPEEARDSQHAPSPSSASRLLGADTNRWGTDTAISSLGGH